MQLRFSVLGNTICPFNLQLSLRAQYLQQGGAETGLFVNGYLAPGYDPQPEPAKFFLNDLVFNKPVIGPDYNFIQ
jgi:hypothetical protein